MATPSLQQARSHHRRAALIVTAAVLAVRRMFERDRPLPEIVTTASAYQYAAATASAASTASMAAEATQPLTIPATFAGVSSFGFPLAEPIVATIDRFIPAPAEALPANWWGEARDFMASVEQLIASEVADAGRSAGQVEFVARPDWTNYVRMLTPPSCMRCTVLAGRIYRDLETFDRHPQCDCVMVPVDDWESAHDAGLVSSPQDLFDQGLVGSRRDGVFESGLSETDAKAITDGADIVKVINAHRGMTTPTMFGHKVKATTEGTTKRAAWRKANPTRLVRLRPESIYQIANDRADAIRLLKLYGYLTS